jgi:hypothetical protein
MLMSVFWAEAWTLPVKPYVSGETVTTSSREADPPLRVIYRFPCGYWNDNLHPLDNLGP